MLPFICKNGNYPFIFILHYDRFELTYVSVTFIMAILIIQPPRRESIHRLVQHMAEAELLTRVTRDMTGAHVFLQHCVDALDGI